VLPRLAPGLELIGEFEDSGFKEAPFIARRADGQVVQMPKMLFRLAEEIDGQSSSEAIAERFSHAVRRNVGAADIEFLIDRQLRPLGVVAPEDAAEEVELGKVDPLLALKFRTAVVPERPVRALTTVFRPLFRSPVVVLVILGLLGLDGWLFFVHGISQSLRHVLYQPALMLLLIGGVVVATAFHEIGHATACRFGGAKPGVMGVGIYIVWPAFYTDITDAYRLSKWGRLRTDLGGMYFNAVFALLVAGAYALTGFEPLLLLIVLQNFAILQQALPLLRLDGYYILSDLTGVPDIFLRIRPVLASMIPGRRADERVTDLKGWVRVVVSLYVLLIVAFLTLSILAMVINLPRIVATGYDSASLRYQAIGPAFGDGQGLRGALDVIQMLFLVLPGAGLIFTAARVGRRTTNGAIKWSAGHPARRAILCAGLAGGVTVAALSWWPNGDYRPIQPGERGTIEGLLSQIKALPSARPSLTAYRQRQLGGAPSLSQRPSAGGAFTKPSSGSSSSGSSSGAAGSSTHTTTSGSFTPTPASPKGTAPTTTSKFTQTSRSTAPSTTMGSGASGVQTSSTQTSTTNPSAATTTTTTTNSTTSTTSTTPTTTTTTTTTTPATTTPTTTTPSGY
jgi:putative peptide zinc metalloprotease protein